MTKYASETMTLTGAGANFDTTYTYDNVGNWLTMNEPGTLTTYAYDSVNRLDTSENAVGVTTYSYDADGNQTLVEAPTGELTTQTWDFENRLSLVQLPDATTDSFIYNADGQRMEKKLAAGGTIEFVGDGERVLVLSPRGRATCRVVLNDSRTTVSQFIADLSRPAHRSTKPSTSSRWIRFLASGVRASNSTLTNSMFLA